VAGNRQHPDFIRGAAITGCDALNKTFGAGNRRKSVYKANMKILLFAILLFPVFCFAQNDERVKQIDAGVVRVDKRANESVRRFVLKKA
jgi:hypothetical protein